jgi:hypothetical protein
MQCQLLLCSVCEDQPCLDAFERKLYHYWSTESLTNREFLHTQAYRVFRANVLCNLEVIKTHPHKQLPPVVCALNNNYRIEFNSHNGAIELKRFWDGGQKQSSDAVSTGKRKQHT